MHRRTLLQTLLSSLPWLRLPAASPSSSPALPPKQTLLPAHPPTRIFPPPVLPLPSSDTTPPWLAEWLSQPMQPVLDRLDLPGRLHEEIVKWANFRRAIHHRLSPVIHYLGGSAPGQPRRITPALIFHKLTDTPAPLPPRPLPPPRSPPHLPPGSDLVFLSTELITPTRNRDDAHFFTVPKFAPPHIQPPKGSPNGSALSKR